MSNLSIEDEIYLYGHTKAVPQFMSMHSSKMKSIMQSERSTKLVEIEQECQYWLTNKDYKYLVTDSCLDC